MKNKQAPSGILLMLAGIALLFSFAFLGFAGASDDVNSTSLEEMRRFHEDFINHSESDSACIGINASAKLSPAIIDPKSMATSRSASQRSPGRVEDLRRQVAIDSAIPQDLLVGGDMSGSNPRINYLNIAVGTVTVVAINMARGGSANANSNIVIQPIQSQGGVDSRSSADERLR
jgi:hypothetical protein